MTLDSMPCVPRTAVELEGVGILLSLLLCGIGDGI